MLKATFIDIIALSALIFIDFKSSSACANRLIMMKRTDLTTSAIIIFTKIFMLATFSIASEF